MRRRGKKPECVPVRLQGGGGGGGGGGTFDTNCRFIKMGRDIGQDWLYFLLIRQVLEVIAWRLHLPLSIEVHQYRISQIHLWDLFVNDGLVALANVTAPSPRSLSVRR